VLFVGKRKMFFAADVRWVSSVLKIRRKPLVKERERTGKFHLLLTDENSHTAHHQ
jgi:hypothetical protein